MLTIQMNTLHRIAMISLLVIFFGLFFYFNVLIIHFYFYPLPNLFSTPTLFSNNNFIESSYCYNCGIYLLFFLQHLFMASIPFKRMLINISPKFVFYERYFFNILSSLTLIFILSTVKPIHQVVFTIPIYFIILPVVIGLYFFIVSIYQLGNQIFFVISPLQIIRSKQLKLPGLNSKINSSFTQDGVYGFCRHPMYLGTILIFLFASNDYSIDRIIFILINFTGIILGIKFQEIKMIQKYPLYYQYTLVVPYKLIPMIY